MTRRELRPMSSTRLLSAERGRSACTRRTLALALWLAQIRRSSWHVDRKKVSQKFVRSGRVHVGATTRRGHLYGGLRPRERLQLHLRQNRSRSRSRTDYGKAPVPSAAPVLRFRIRSGFWAERDFMARFGHSSSELAPAMLVPWRWRRSNILNVFSCV